MASAGHLKSPALTAAGFRHAFFTRRGGVSGGPYASLNFSYGVGDEARDVDENFARAAAVIGITPERTYFLSQVHGRSVVELSGNEDRRETMHVEGDALTSTSTTVACGVRTADCVPVLIACEATGRVAAVHAGWRGVEQNIVAETVKLFSTAHASTSLVAAIGPHISSAAFEVSDDVAERLQHVAGSLDVVRRDVGPKPHVDLRKIVRAQLEGAGVASPRVDDVLGCTMLEQETYFSYRRDGKRSGRHLSVIVAREPR